jgi:hypothetical protein
MLGETPVEDRPQKTVIAIVERLELVDVQQRALQQRFAEDYGEMLIQGLVVRQRPTPDGQERHVQLRRERFRGGAFARAAWAVEIDRERVCAPHFPDDREQRVRDLTARMVTIVVWFRST